MSPVAGARYAQQQITGGPPPTGPPVAGYVAWYDPSDAGSITSSGGAVSQLDDKSGNGRHLTNATGGTQPTTGTRTQNGLNVLDFDGTNDQLSVSGFTLTQPYTVFAVALSDDGADATGQRITDGQASSTILGKTTANSWNLFAGTGLLGGTVDGGAHVHGGVFDGATSTRRVDGAVVASGNGGTSSHGGLRLAISNTGTNFWDGWIAEVVMYPTGLSAGDCSSVEAYLKTKWGTP